MSAMSDMSRAMRHVVEDYSTGPTLKDVPIESLREFVTIVGAFYADLQDEVSRRDKVTA